MFGKIYARPTARRTSHNSVPFYATHEEVEPVEDTNRFPKDEVFKVLRNTPYEVSDKQIERVFAHDYEYPNLFKIVLGNGKSYSVKVRNIDEQHVTESIKCLERIRDTESLIQKYTCVIKTPEFYFLISDWIDGRHPEDNRQSRISDFFESLGKLNISNSSEGPFKSMYSGIASFDSIQELLDCEIGEHLKYLDKTFPIRDIRSVLSSLYRGEGCLVFEDMNIGNMRISDSGKLYLIDTEWLHYGLNLLQFDHVNYFGFEKNEWYNITDTAKSCYAAYFSQMEFGEDEVNAQIRGIELLSLLRSNTYERFCGRTVDQRKLRNKLDVTISQRDFI